MGGDEGQARQWLHTPNRHLNGVPAERIVNVQGLVDVVQYLDAVRGRNLQLTCIAGLAGLPQVSVPAGRIDGGPVGFGLIGPRGSDRALLDLAVAVAA